MCGLFGFTTDRSAQLTRNQANKRAKILKGLAVAMQDRGDKSTGILYLRDDKYFRNRTTNSAKNFIKIAEVQNTFSNPETKMILGHTRNPSSNMAVSEETAHPLRHGSIIGCHNGMIYNWRNIDDKAGVDSEVIFKCLDEAEGDFNKAFGRLRGQAAITWINLDNDNQYINMVSHEKPLSFIQVDRLKTVFWASLPFALESVVESVIGLDKDEALVLGKDAVVTFDGDLDFTVTDTKFKEWNTATAFGSGDYTWEGWSGFLKEKNTAEDDDGDVELFSLQEQSQILYDFMNSKCLVCNHLLPWNNEFYWSEAFVICNGCASKEEDVEKDFGVMPVSVSTYKAMRRRSDEHLGVPVAIMG